MKNIKENNVYIVKNLVKKSVFTFAFLAFLNIVIYAQDTNKNIESTNNKISSIDTTKHFPLHLFTYAGEQRYTLNGEPPNLHSHIRPATTAVLGGIYLGTLVWLHFHQQNAWWSGQRKSFHFQEDWAYALQVDKFGHSFGGYLISYLASEGLIASGLSWDDATIWGSIFGFTYQTYVEIEDGFANSWGFSPSDLYFDAFGPIFFLSQHFVPALQNITPKWQYIPSEWTGEPIINRPRTFLDDYNSSTFWWSVNIYNIIPDTWKKYWVPWLDLAVGYGADAIDAPRVPGEPPDQLTKRRYVVGLDYNLVRLLPNGGWFWNWFRQSLNFIKLPSPAIEFSSKGTRFKLLYPFRINLGSIKF